MRALARLTPYLVTAALLGCAPASETDLIGTWQIADGSREHLSEELRQTTGRLTLAADGTFVAFELPVAAYRWTAVGDPRPPIEEPTLLTGSGGWKLRPAAVGNDTVRLRIEAVSGELTGDLSDGYALSVRPAFGGYRLVDYWGDPDSVPGIFYSRIEAENEPWGPTEKAPGTAAR